MSFDQEESDKINELPSAPGGVKKNAFVHKLYSMLSDPKLSHVIWWSEDNSQHNTFSLLPGKEFSQVLTNYFKHGNVASFVRQLHMYGFHKVNDNNGDNSIWEFKHSSGKFKKDDEASLILIKRRSSSNSSKNAPPTYRSHSTGHILQRPGQPQQFIPPQGATPGEYGVNYPYPYPYYSEYMVPVQYVPYNVNYPPQYPPNVTVPQVPVQYTMGQLPQLQTNMLPIIPNIHSAGTPTSNKSPSQVFPTTHSAPSSAFPLGQRPTSLPSAPMAPITPGGPVPAVGGPTSIPAMAESKHNASEQVDRQIMHSPKTINQHRQSNTSPHTIPKNAVSPDTNNKSHSQTSSPRLSKSPMNVQQYNPLQFRKIWDNTSNSRPRNPSLLFDPLAPGPGLANNASNISLPNPTTIGSGPSSAPTSLSGPCSLRSNSKDIPRSISVDKIRPSLVELYKVHDSISTNNLIFLNKSSISSISSQRESSITSMNDRHNSFGLAPIPSIGKSYTPPPIKSNHSPIIRSASSTDVVNKVSIDSLLGEKDDHKRRKLSDT